MTLSVIILSYNTKKLLSNCLNSVIKNTQGIDDEIIVVDNASTDGSVSLVKQKFPQVRLVRNTKNLGFAAGNNRGLEIARGKWVLFLNTDTEIKKNAPKKLVDFAKTKPKLGVVGPRLLNADNSRQPAAARFFTLPNVFLWLFCGDRLLFESPDRAKKADWVMGSAFLVKRKAVEKVGGLDEKFFMYIEDQEWCYRFKKAGFEVWFYPEAEIYHFVRGSSPEGKQKAIWWIYEGLIYFYQKHFAPWQLRVLRLMLLTKASATWSVGVLTNNIYLKKTYAKAFKIACRV